MSGVLGVFAQRVPDEAVVEQMLDAMAARGSVPAAQRQPTAILARCHHPWEEALSGRGGLACRDGVTVAADATLYYRASLAGALDAAGIDCAPGASVAELILGAYEAWGAACAERLEGDFAFVLWDRRRRRVLCARDFSGRRPLYYACRAGTLCVASTVGSLLAYPDTARELDLGTVAATAAGLFAAAASRTAYRDIAVLPAGRTLSWLDGALAITTHWAPAAARPSRAAPRLAFEDAAAELRSLLEAAVAERVDPRAGSSVWLSGGWDSTAVFGAGNAALRAAGRHDLLRPISISYPPGDPGREDEWIALTAARWGAQVHWLDIRDIPLLESPVERALRRDEPFAHTYEHWIRALATGSHAVGSRVALDGVGGDQLFQVSPVYLADLLVRGRWLSLRREAAARGITAPGTLLRWALLPHLPPRLRRRVLGWRGGHDAHYYLERPVPPWVRHDFLARHCVVERERDGTPPRRSLPHASYEMHWYLTHPYGALVLACVSSIALEEGVELRSPLYDPRIVRFALSRPWSERSHRGATKRLLRRAVHDVVPGPVLAPRVRRTGVTSGYLAHSLRHRHADLIAHLFRDSALADLGIVDANILRDSWARYRDERDEGVAISLLFTLHTELWLRSRALR